MTQTLRTLLDRADRLDDAEVTAFLDEKESPIVDGTSVTFLHRGDAEEVLLRHFIYGFPRSLPFRRVGSTDLWFLTMEIPKGSRVEYKIEVLKGGRRRLLRDPLNPNIAHDPYGANSVCQGEGYQRPQWTLHDPESRPGTLETVEIASKVYGASADVEVYLPARMRTSRRYPLLVVFDGSDYVRYAGLKTVLDNLIHRYEISPMIVALSQSPDRFADYTASRDHARYVVDDLIPALEALFPVSPRISDRGLMGASLGAVASLFTASCNPDRFGGLLLQSGTFRFQDTGYEEVHPALGSVVEFVNGFREHPGRVAERVFVTCGTYEGLVYENRSMVPLLQQSGMRVRYLEARDGHNWENWRDRLRAGLGWLFPGPIGLVYE